MSFQAYLDTIKEKTGLTPDDFEKIARERGLLEGDIKAGPIIAVARRRLRPRPRARDGAGECVSRAAERPAVARATRSTDSSRARRRSGS